MPHSSTPSDPTAQRRSGVLLHVSSLPDGKLGPEAYAFVDWLAEAGQSWWQILPLTPPDAHGSPYASPSAFATWPGFLAHPRSAVSGHEIASFRERNAYWIDDWVRVAGPDALADQIRFDREWNALRRHAADRGVRIMGDIPFYVAPHAADVRAHPDLFREDLVAGVPPDAFTADGQLWGNPTYDWDAMAHDGQRWWIERLRRSAELHDCLRIDHFRAFEAWWGVPKDARLASEGAWYPGPGTVVIEAAREQLGPLSLVAEDLGIITPGVHHLMDHLGLPGMRVLQFAFSGGHENTHRPEHHPERSVVYSGTHDNDTAHGWWLNADPDEREQLLATGAAMGIHEARPERLLSRMALASRGGLAIVTMQDLLGLDSGARLNTPGTAHGNWTWRLRQGELTPELAAWLRDETERSGRLA